MIGNYCQQNYSRSVNEGSGILWNNIKGAMCGGVF
jgi:hypothetical protein